MNSRRSILSMLLLLFLLLALPIGAEADDAAENPFREGTVVIDSLRGKVVLVDFWASWCVPCRRSFPWMNALIHEYADDGLVVIAVNVDKDRKVADAFLAEHPGKMRIVYDPEGKLAESYGLKAMPSSFLYDREGTLRESRLGFREKEAAELRKVIAKLLSEKEES